VASGLAGCLRDTDSVTGPAEAPAGAGERRVVARLGGDEFTVLLDGLREPADAARVAERILAAVCRPVEFDGQEVTVTASVGIVTGGPGYGSAADLLRDADAAMYKAKEAGRNRYAIFDGTLHQAAVTRLRLEADLRRAIGRGELLLHYQPIVSLQTRELAGFEAWCGGGGTASWSARPSSSRWPRRPADRPARPVGVGRGVPATGRLAGGRTRAGPRRPSALTSPAASSTTRTWSRSGAGAGRDEARPRPGEAGDHRERDHGRHGRRPGRSNGGQAAGRAAVDGRLRHRVLVAILPAPGSRWTS
jgi:hypothetical protein